MSRARGIVELLIVLFIVSQFPRFAGLSDADEWHLRDLNRVVRREDALVQSLPVSGSPPNITGYDALNPIPSQISKQLKNDFENHSRATFYTNVSSLLKGHSKRMHLQPPPRTMNSSVKGLDLKNSSFLYGRRPLEHEKVGIWINSHYHLNGTSMLRAYLEFQSSQFGVDLYGVYTDDGKATLASNSLKFSGFRATPYLAEADVSRTFVKMQRTLEFNDLKLLEERALECEWVLQGIVHAHHATHKEVWDAEEELAHPRGAPIKKVPNVHFSGTIWSPDCGLAYETSMKGERAERRTARTFKVCTIAVLGVITLIILSSLFYRSLNTASKLCRVGFWTLALMSLTDGVVCIVSLLLSLDDSYGLPAMALAILALLLVGMFDLQLMVTIFGAQLTEQAGNARAAGETRTAELPSDREIMNLIYTRYYLVIVLFFASLSLLSLGDKVRRTYECVLLAIIYSFWWPQIWHSARRGTVIPFSMKWIVTTGVIRLAPTVYMCVDRHNVGLHRHSPHLGFAVVGWQVLQMVILGTQIKFGPRFFLPLSFFAKGYDYHRLLVISDVEANDNAEQPPTLEPLHQQGAEYDERLGCEVKPVACAVCMYDVRLPLIENTTQVRPAILSETQKYMVTPCQHAFHTECLERWMHARLQCPVCRCPLPPI